MLLGEGGKMVICCQNQIHMWLFPDEMVTICRGRERICGFALNSSFFSASWFKKNVRMIKLELKDNHSAEGKTSGKETNALTQKQFKIQ